MNQKNIRRFNKGIAVLESKNPCRDTDGNHLIIGDTVKYTTIFTGKIIATVIGFNPESKEKPIKLIDRTGRKFYSIPCLIEKEI